ncbi:TauD/TfdA family dioxygenase [Fulvivirga sp. 29W222]|uniref:TauD/TfdA family dioxygenase n=1 Tax=Fulvivirga marina TaxID=2494733 RepID=A0A937FTP0_9BACT|nr:TauD/TfdA family dioxygenase [Fulvivirga marina]MBL6445750.1 TauD/TfdA family dioxygenase [Fulvivirga marina]
MKAFNFDDFFSKGDQGYYSCNADTISNFENILYNEEGYFILKGFPLEGSSEQEIQTNVLKWAFTLGVPLSETIYDDFVVRLEDIDTAKTGSNKVRNRPLLVGQENAGFIPMHNDRADLLVLFGVTPSKREGETFMVSTNKICSQLMKDYPEQFATLREKFSYHYPGGTLKMPIISESSKGLIMWYVRSRIENKEELSVEQMEALNMLDKLIDEHKEGVVLQHGNICVINNHKALHGRQKFPEGDDRLLYRVWLSDPRSCELPDHYMRMFRYTKSGSYRGGVWSDEFDQELIPSDINMARENVKHLLHTDQLVKAVN